MAKAMEAWARKGAGRSAGERALVEGRRPGVGEAAVFDEAAVEAMPGGFTGEGPVARPCRLRRDRDRGRQRPRRKLGSRSKTPQSGGAARRSIRSRLRQDREASRHRVRTHRGNPGAPRETGCGKAEAGGSPSSEASPGGSSEAIGRRWAGVSRRARGPRGSRARRGAHLGIGQSAGCSDRRSVAEVGETHLSRGR